MPVCAAMEETPVLAALEGGVLTLMLNRPQRLNAMSHGLIEAMNHELARARDDADIRAVLLTGIGRGFCAGADLAGGGPGDPDADGQPDLGAAMDRLFNPMIRAMRALPKPIVGGDQRRGGGRRRQPGAGLRHRAGGALGPLRPGLRAHLADPRSRRHLVPAAHRGRCPRPRARHAGQLGAGRGGRAHGHGLAGGGRCRADGGGDASSRIAWPPGPTLSYAAIKQAINAAATNTLDQQLDLERDSQRALGRSADFKEGVAAFLAKRPANFTGR